MNRASLGGARVGTISGRKDLHGGCRGTPSSGACRGTGHLVPSQRVPAQVLVGMRRAGPFAFGALRTPAGADVSLATPPPDRPPARPRRRGGRRGARTPAARGSRRSAGPVGRSGTARWWRRAGSSGVDARSGLGAGGLLGRAGRARRRARPDAGTSQRRVGRALRVAPGVVDLLAEEAPDEPPPLHEHQVPHQLERRPARRHQRPPAARPRAATAPSRRRWSR